MNAQLEKYGIFIQLESILRLKRTTIVILLALNLLTVIKLSLMFIRFTDFDMTKHTNLKLLKIGLLLHRLYLDLHYLNQKRSCDWSVEKKRYLLLVNFWKQSIVKKQLMQSFKCQNELPIPRDLPDRFAETWLTFFNSTVYFSKMAEVCLE